jgi:hypothetical protein
MHTTKHVHWQEDESWLGYLEEYPDYWTQGETEASTTGIATRYRRVPTCASASRDQGATRPPHHSAANGKPERPFRR